MEGLKTSYWGKSAVKWLAGKRMSREDKKIYIFGEGWESFVQAQQKGIQKLTSTLSERKNMIKIRKRAKREKDMGQRKTCGVCETEGEQKKKLWVITYQVISDLSVHVIFL